MAPTAGNPIIVLLRGGLEDQGFFTSEAGGGVTTADGGDMQSLYSDGGPPFPGEDFVMDLPDGIFVDLADGNSKIVISVEPDVKGVDPTGDAPFALKPLAGAVPSGLSAGTYTTLGTGPNTTTSGMATFTSR